ncbi:Hypp4276 [Branchiostoma lanceolatum]|uniref:Hypp4276 protein n=1 Tax=Branchiostoma lanceolatum TaxID=7740 RepID=A0A8K0A7C6_BRALA|nr:Hypp4276 [Branchiostoma lanceolatum]
MDQSEHTAKSMKEKENNASDNLPQDSQGAESMDQSGNTAESVKEKEKNASDIQLVNRVQIEECEMDQRNADPDHSYASHSLSKASPSSCSRPSISAEDMWFKEGESLSPEELVLYGLLLVRGKHPGGKKAAKLECFTTQAGNNGGFTSVATAANRISAASKYSAEGIKTYLSLGHQPVGRYKGNFRWEHFLSEVQDLVEKQGRNLHLLLSGADDIDMQGIRDTAANICEENRVQQASLCPSNTGLNLKSLQEVWKDKLRDQWTHCHLTCSESKAMIHFLSPADSSSPGLQKTIHIHQDMTWVLKVRGQTCTRKLWGDLTSTVSNLSQLRTVLQFVQDGFVCIGCDYDRFSEVVDRTVVADVKVESLGDLTSVRSEQCVLFTTNYYKVWKMKGTNSDHVDSKNVCHMCRKKNNDLEAVLNWLNDHKAKGTITSTTSSEFTPRRTLEQQLREKRVRRNQEKCHKTIQTLRERLRETKAELAAAQEKLDRVKSRPRELLITRQELATLQKEVLSRQSVTIRGTLV